ncbi:MAG: dTDP-4-dehydrorhamnose reductase [Actinomycetota bacterium]
MKLIRPLVLGAHGQVGEALCRLCQSQNIPVLGLGRAQAPLDNLVDLRDALTAHIQAFGPAQIINAAAYTAVDRAETEPHLAHRVNAEAVGLIGEIAVAHGLPVVHYSTDYVFDGTKPTPYVETDTPNPQSVYGASKLAGEQAVDTSIDMVVRISWVCGFHGANMVKTILRIAAQQDTLTFVDDQIGYPTFADDAAKMITRLATEARTGIWHVTNQGAVSWYEFTREVLRVAGHDPARVKPVRTRDLTPPRPAPRPANSVLDNAALRSAGIALLDDFRLPLARLVKRLVVHN